jgi:hypothetical protein
MASRNLPWLFVAGNARKVHSFVDTVMDDGAAAGTAAAAYLGGLLELRDETKLVIETISLV